MESRPLARVVWQEGMHLAQHHFQAQSRFFEDTASFALSALHFGTHGFAALELDREALLNGTVTLTHARGFLPDGLPFHFPHDPPPEPLEIRDLFSPTEPAHDVHLAIPAYRPGGANTAPEEAPDVRGYRFVPHREERADELSGEERRPVITARKNFRLVLDGELGESEGLVSLPVARVRRDGAGNFEFDAHFVPPSLRLAASRRLVAVVERVAGMLEARGEALVAERKARGNGDAGAAEVAEMWLAHAVHQSLPMLRHLTTAGDVHPERAYLELARLAGALCTFSLEARPDDLPLYDHDALGPCFTGLESRLREQLEVVLPSGSYRLGLTSSDGSFHEVEVPDTGTLSSADLYVGIRSSASDAEVLSAVPRLVKVCSSQHIRRLVKEAFPGMKLTHLPAPPAAIRPRAGAHYYHVEKAGPCWASIVDTGGIGVYTPGSLPDAEPEMVVVPRNAPG